MNRIRQFFSEYTDELFNKVSWKTESLQRNTITVLVASLLIAVVIAVIDLAFNRLLSAFYETFVN